MTTKTKASVKAVEPEAVEPEAVTVAPETMQEAIERLEIDMDLAPDTIRVVNPRWLQLMREGVLISLHIARWRAKTQLSWADLGLKLDKKDKGEEGEEDDAANLFRLGVKRLLPLKYIRELDSIDSAARNALARLSYRTHWGCFVPVDAYKEVKEVMDEYKTRYMNARKEIVAGYDTIVAELRDSYFRTSLASYDRMRTLAGEGFKISDEWGDLSPETRTTISSDEWAALNDAEKNALIREDWAATLTENVIRQMPTQDQIDKSFRFDLELSFIPLPDLLAREEKAAAQTRTEIELSQAEKQAQLAAIAEREETIRLQEKAERRKADAEVQAAESVIATRERLLEKMNQEVIQEARDKKTELMNGFFTSIKGQLNTLIYEVCVNVLAALETNGQLHSRHIIQLKNLVDTVGKLNFYGDQDAEDAIRNIRASILSHPTTDINASQVSSVLRSIAIVTSQQLIGLGEKPRLSATTGTNNKKKKTTQKTVPVGSLGIPTGKDPIMLRHSRSILALDDSQLETILLPERQPRRLVD